MYYSQFVVMVKQKLANADAQILVIVSTSIPHVLRMVTVCAELVIQSSDTSDCLYKHSSCAKNGYCVCRAGYTEGNGGLDCVPGTV